MTSDPHPAYATPSRRPLSERVLAAFLRAAMRTYLFVVPESKGLRDIEPGRDLTVLLTGQFYAANWAGAHLKPIAAAIPRGRVLVVSGHPVPASPGVTIILPPRSLSRLIGEVPARMVTLVWVALRERPDFIGGFHLLFNGLVAPLVARLVGASSIYFCVGGVAEFAGGGTTSENRVFGRLSVPDPVLETLLAKAVRRFDVIVTMGTRAAAHFVQQGVPGRVVVNPGGIDDGRFSPPADQVRDIDVLLVGRLVPIKRIDRFLRMVGMLVAHRPELRAVVVGSGPLAADLQRLANELGIAAHVEFAGHRTDVERFLHRAKVFVLSSQSEGVALSLMEAMTAGAVPVVSNVGDLGDVVDPGAGFLVDDLEPATFARHVGDLLSAPETRLSMSRAAVARASEYSIAAATRRWLTVFGQAGRP